MIFINGPHGFYREKLQFIYTNKKGFFSPSGPEIVLMRPRVVHDQTEAMTQDLNVVSIGSTKIVSKSFPGSHFQMAQNIKRNEAHDANGLQKQEQKAEYTQTHIFLVFLGFKESLNEQ